MKFLFWNTYNNKRINPVICDLIAENGVSIAVLAEYADNINSLIETLKARGITMHVIPTLGCDRIHIIGGAGLRIEPYLQTDRASIQVIDDKYILCGVHLNSQLYSDNTERREIEIERIVRDVLKIESEINSKDTIIVGDFNINPYDKSCVSARYFHSIPVFEEAARETRIVEGREYQMFYNPMWNFLGDFKEPYGTYYCNSGNTVNPYWNTYDQVIIRPALRNRFVKENLNIITQTVSTSLLDKKKHPDHSISDHLPITFEIKETEL